MITFEQGMDVRCREVTSPKVAKFRTHGTNYAYCVIGTDYGYIHTKGGDVRVWASYSGAHRAARKYLSL